MSETARRELSLRDMLAFIRVQIHRGGYTIRDGHGIATCPAELMLNIDAILDAAERGLSKD